MINITTISDTHGKHHMLDVGSGDLIIHAGDCTPRGSNSDIEEFIRWYGDLKFRMKVLIAGNHDFGFERDPDYCQELCNNYGVTLLNDSGVKFEGVRIWGSPITPWFYNWAYNRMRTEAQATAKHPYIGNHWDLIPKNTDILVTHGPVHGILDRTESGVNAGCEVLLKKVKEIQPIMHICGHIHEDRGIVVDRSSGSPTTFVNTSSLDLDYKPRKDKAYKFEWDSLLIGQSRGED